jgi:DNA topoisomerase-2
MSATAIELGSSSVNDSAAVGGCNTPRERMILHPEDYIGSVDKCTRNLWVVEGNSFRRRLVTYEPGLHKIFDDVLVYAAENKQHDPTMNSLSVDIDVAECRVSVCFDGRGVPIDLHPVEGIYMPEMVFGDVSNLEETAAGGRNSSGVKMANLFSTDRVRHRDRRQPPSEEVQTGDIFRPACGSWQCVCGGLRRRQN